MPSMTVTKYSDKIEGDRGNYDWPVSFDLTGKYLGITQHQGGKVTDRVLLSPKQVRELVAFVEAKGATAKRRL